MSADAALASVKSPGAGAGARAAVLIALVLAVFHRSWLGALTLAMHEPEALHVWLAPLMIVLVLWRRCAALCSAAGNGSPLGLALIALALAIHALGAWWWCPDYLWRIALVPGLAGAIATAAGWGAMIRCLPALLLVWLMIPPGSAYLPFFIVVDDAYTASIVPLALNLLGAAADFRVADLLAQRTSEAMLLLGLLSMAVVAATIRARSRRQIITISILSLPAAAACHLMRTVGWTALEASGWRGSGLVTARSVTAAAALALALGIFFLAARIVRTTAAEDGVRKGGS